MEQWKDIPGFSGYQVSDEGRVRTFRTRKHKSSGYGTYWLLSDIPTIMNASDDGNGYLKVMLYGDDGHRYCKKVHRLVAEAFVPKEPGCDTVDHILSGAEGKKDNSAGNLRWISRADNIKKAYLDGMCDERIANSKKEVVVTDNWTGDEKYFRSIGEAALYCGVHYTTISHAFEGEVAIVGNGRYRVEQISGKEALPYREGYYECY